MATFADFLAHVLPYVGGCSIPLAELHLRGICGDFCSHAPIVQLTLDPIDLVAGQVEYDVDVPNGTDVALILDASYHGRALGCMKTGDAPLTAAPRIAAPSAYRQGSGNAFTLDAAPAADEPGVLVLQVATKPSKNTRQVADILLNDYGYEIGMGAVGRLMMIPGHPFSNPGLAPVYTATYLKARTEARIRAESSFGRSSTRVRPRPFG